MDMQVTTGSSAVTVVRPFLMVDALEQPCTCIGCGYEMARYYEARPCSGCGGTFCVGCVTYDSEGVQCYCAQCLPGVA